MVFFHLPEAAQRAGFRPCFRCRPDAPHLDDPRARLIQQACRLIESHESEQPLTLTALAAHLHISPFHLQRTFKRITGISPRQYAEASRLERAKALFKAGRGITSALYDAGYGSSSRLYEKSSIQLGMTPGAYARGGKGMRIRYTVVDSPLGRLLVAGTERGVCAVSLGASDGELTATLFAEYPAAEILLQESGLGEWVSALLKHLEGCEPHLELPLDVRVTAFRWRVYEALRAIPYGERRSYTEVARALGNPKAVRAVAAACAGNPVALIIPCHRVVRKDGSAAGYRWGIDRKKSLLEQEQRSAAFLKDSTS